MPSDTNPHGHIFGGWLMSQMDLAGGTCAHFRAQGPVATVGVDSMAFHQPVFVGDQLTCFADIVRVGRTSITVKVEAWVRRMSDGSEVKVTEGTFTFVAVDGEQRPRVVPPLP
ncbi:MAG: acyl-CoA thioesterase [Rhodospirillales bacterium]|nr:MAG: acyl-CoA thioesterase [Rhodospirillales bacterium]